MTNVGGIPAELTMDIDPDLVWRFGVPFLASWLVLSMLLSARMVVRLRLALAEHAQALAALRDEPDDPWRFRPTERTYVLFLLVQVLLPLR